MGDGPKKKESTQKIRSAKGRRWQLRSVWTGDDERVDIEIVKRLKEFVRFGVTVGCEEGQRRRKKHWPSRTLTKERGDIQWNKFRVLIEFHDLTQKGAEREREREAGR